MGPREEYRGARGRPSESSYDCLKVVADQTLWSNVAQRRAAAKPKATDRIAEDLMALVDGVQRTATGVLRDSRSARRRPTGRSTAP